MISGAVRARLAGGFGVVALGPRALKGFGEKVPVYEVAWR